VALPISGGAGAKIHSKTFARGSFQEVRPSRRNHPCRFWWTGQRR